MMSKITIAAAVAATAASAASVVMEYVNIDDITATHYGNPFDGACESDEKNLTFSGGDAICGAKCGVAKPCPKDVPEGMTAKPSCFHAVGLSTYCITKCSNPSDCGADHVDCNSNGECVYTGPSGHSPAPGPSKPPAPGPSKPPAPAPSKQTHYGDPYDVSCLSDEVNVTITGVQGAFCSPKCSGTTCPSDMPAGAHAKPTCALQPSGSSTPTQCALICSPSLPIEDQKAADQQCGANASCKPIQGAGVCTYDDGAPPQPAPSPSPKPPAPAPGPSACPTCTFSKLTIDPPPAVMIGVGTSSANSAYAAAGYSSGGSTILKTTDGGTTFSKIKTANDTLILLGTASLSADEAFAGGLLSGEYTLNGGEGGMKRSLLIGGGQSIEAFGTKSYAVVGENQVAISTDSGILFEDKKLTGVDTKTFPGRYGSYPSDSVIYVSAGQFPTTEDAKDSDYEIVFRRTERHEIRRNTTTGELYTHWYNMDDLKNFKDGQYTGAIFKSTDGGSSWTTVFSNTGNYYFNDIHCYDETHCVAVAEAHNTASPGAHIFTTVDGNTFFPSHFEAGEVSFSGARFVSSNEAFVTGSDLSKSIHRGIFLQSLNGAFNWTHHDSEASMIGQDLLDLDCSAADSCYAASVTQLSTSELLVYKKA